MQVELVDMGLSLMLLELHKWVQPRFVCLQCSTRWSPAITVKPLVGAHPKVLGMSVLHSLLCLKSAQPSDQAKLNTISLEYGSSRKQAAERMYETR